MYLIYAFIDQNGTPFYVGKTKDLRQRKKDHSHNIRKGNPLPKYHKVRKLIRQGFEFAVQIIEEVDSKDNPNDREKHWIKYLRESGVKLYNLTDGGDGGAMSYEVRKRISAKLKGMRMSDEHYSALSDLMKSLWQDPEMRAVWIGSKTGKPRTELTKKRISESNKGKTFSDEHKKKLSVARRKRSISIETRRRCSATSKGRINIKKYILTDPNGEEHLTEHGLSDFCRKHELTASLIIKVAKGERQHHKGWTAKKLDN